MDHIEGQNRNQVIMTSLDQMVHPEAFVRIIDAFVDALDLSIFGFRYFDLNKEGRPPFHPKVLMKLYLYGYQHGVRSCRKLEHAAKVNVEVTPIKGSGHVWLLQGRHPHFKTIANFRKDNATAFRDVFRHFVLILKDWNLVDGKTMAIDSFKVRAQNSLKKNFNEKKIDRHLDYIDTKINEYEHQLNQENSIGDRNRIKNKINHNIDKWNHYCKIGQELIDQNIDQISTTDPDAKAVVLHRNIVNVGYNIQAVSDGKHKMLVAMDTGSVNDTHALCDMVSMAKQNLDIKKSSVLADKGYHTGAQIAACEQLNATTYVSPKANAANKQYNVFPMEDFKYHPGSDTYRCPNNEILRSNEKFYERTSSSKNSAPVKFKHYKTKACKNCPIKTQCTSSDRGRVIQRSIHQSAIDRNNNRVNNNPDYYRQRQQIIEHQFGTFKRQWHFDHVLVRGKDKVLGEVSLLFTAYNLRRSASIFGFEGITKRLKALFSCIFRLFMSRRATKYLSDRFYTQMSHAPWSVEQLRNNYCLN